MYILTSPHLQDFKPQKQADAPGTLTMFADIGQLLSSISKH